MLRTVFAVMCVVGVVRGGGDAGPGDPEFSANDGDLESATRPLEAPRGNFHVVDEEGVLVLNRDTFAHVVMPKDLIMVEFYAPWCGHCKRLEPEYVKAAAKLRSHNVSLAKVDATKEAELAKEYMVQGFPTLTLFRDGVKVEDYEGARTADAISEYMLRQADPEYKPPPSAVQELTADNFSKFVKDEPLTLVMFYAPWCKHCKQLQPEYEGAAAELREWGIKLAKVDGTREKELADQYNIGGWPALKLFRKGRIYSTEVPREKANIIDFMRQQAKSPSNEYSNLRSLLNNLERAEPTVVGYFRDDKSDLYDEFVTAANEMRGRIKFIHTFDEASARALLTHMNLTTGSGAALNESVSVLQPEHFWSPYEPHGFSLSKKSATSREITMFVRRFATPLVGLRTKKNAQFLYSNRPLVVIYFAVDFSPTYAADTQYIRRKVVEAAKPYVNSNLRFALSNEDEFEDELKGLDLADSARDVHVACFTEKQKFRMEIYEDEDDFESVDLTNFVNSLGSGHVKPFMRSLPVPKTQDDKHVLKVVANSYDELVHRVKKDAVIFFYAPWCGHCKDFDPIFKKVAKKMSADNPNIVFAKMDGGANDIPYMFPPIKGFPAVYFVSAFEKFDPILYNGDRSYKSVRDWVNRHSSIFLTEEERTGREAADDAEIESFTNEDFNDAVHNDNKDNLDDVESADRAEKETKEKKDEL